MHDFLKGGVARFEVNSRSDHVFDISEENLENLKDSLIKAEEVAFGFRVPGTRKNSKHLRNIFLFRRCLKICKTFWSVLIFIKK